MKDYSEELKSLEQLFTLFAGSHSETVSWKTSFWFTKNYVA